MQLQCDPDLVPASSLRYLFPIRPSRLNLNLGDYILYIFYSYIFGFRLAGMGESGMGGFESRDARENIQYNAAVQTLCVLFAR